MMMKTTVRPGDGGSVEHVVEFRELGVGIPDVMLILGEVRSGDTTLHLGVVEVAILGAMLTSRDVEKVAKRLPGLTATAIQAVSPAEDDELAVTVMTAGKDAGIPSEVAQAALIYMRAIDEGRRPLQAVMKDLHLTKATASRRVRAAKDAGLIAESTGGAS